MRHGVLRHGDWFAAAGAAGKVRRLWHLHGDERNDIEHAVAGTAARVSVAWQDNFDSYDGWGNSFEVGDALHVMSRDDALTLAAYRANVFCFLMHCNPWASGPNVPSAEEQSDFYRRSARLRGTKLYRAQVEELEERGVELEEFQGTAPTVVSPLLPATMARASEQLAIDGEASDEGETGDGKPVAAVIKTRSAGELQALIDFLHEPGRTKGKLEIVSQGVGHVCEHDLLRAKGAMQQGVRCAIYTLNVPLSKTGRQQVKREGYELHEYDIFHDLLTDVLVHAGLEGPVRELADMSDDGSLIDPKLSSSQRNLRLAD